VFHSIHQPAERVVPPELLKTRVSSWYTPLAAVPDAPGIAGYQRAPVHVGMVHPPQSTKVRKELLRYLNECGISRTRPPAVSLPPLRARMPEANVGGSSSAPQLPRWCPSGLTPVRSSIPGMLPVLPPGALLPDRPGLKHGEFRQVPPPLPPPPRAQARPQLS
ncbi:unnamed protein product, partial [Polarella glacialis]